MTLPGNYGELETESSMLYWYPKIRDVLPTPVTKILPLSKENKTALVDALDGVKLPSALVDSLLRTGNKFGYPLFLRTDQFSGKHSWKDTCYVTDERHLIGHVVALIEESLCAGFMGVSFDAMVFREFITLESTFVAFAGNMPIAKERRYYVRDGKVIGHTPYWPEDAICPPRGGSLPDGWESLLAELNRETPEEIEYLTGLAERWPLPGYWSVDFACAVNGKWWFIDAARGELSWHPKNCPFNPNSEEDETKEIDYQLILEDEK